MVREAAANLGLSLQRCRQVLGKFVHDWVTGGAFLLGAVIAKDSFEHTRAGLNKLEQWWVLRERVDFAGFLAEKGRKTFGVFKQVVMRQHLAIAL